MKLEMVILILLLVLNKNKICESTCISKPTTTESVVSEQIVGGSQNEQEYQIQICQQGTTFCLRTNDENSIYLYNEMFIYPASFFKMKFISNDVVTFQNVKNNLYLASFLNGYVFLTSLDSVFIPITYWKIKVEENFNEGKINSKKIVNLVSNMNLFNLDYFNVKTESNRYTNFDLVTRFFNQKKDKLLGLNEFNNYDPYLTDNYGNTQAWILECFEYQKFFLKHYYSPHYLVVGLATFESNKKLYVLTSVKYIYGKDYLFEITNNFIKTNINATAIDSGVQFLLHSFNGGDYQIWYSF